jgi:hypothetical protein
MDDYKVVYDKIQKIIDSQARNLVGILLKRIEVLEKEKALSPSLYKSLAKELVYENSRQIKALIRVHLEIGKVIFKSKEK